MQHLGGAWTVAPSTHLAVEVLNTDNVIDDAHVQVGADGLFSARRGTWTFNGDVSGAGAACTWASRVVLANPDALAGVATVNVGDCNDTIFFADTTWVVATGVVAHVQRVSSNGLLQITGGGKLSVVGDGAAATTDLELGVRATAGRLRIIDSAVELAPGATGSWSERSDVQLDTSGAGASFTNHGTLAWSDATFTIGSGGAASQLVNAADGVIDVAPTIAPIGNADSRARYGNGGTFVNLGRLNVRRYRFDLDPGQTVVLQMGGIFDVSPSATLLIGNTARLTGTLHLSAGSLLHALQSFNPSASARVEVDVAGPADTQHGLIAVDVNTALNGTLAVATSPAYAPVSDAVDIVRTTGTQTGQFATFTAPPFNGGFGTWTPQYGAQVAQIVAHGTTGGTIRIDASTPQSLLDVITVLTGDVVIDMTGITSLSIPNLTQVNGSLTIATLTQATTLSLPKLTTVTGDLSITIDSTVIANLGMSALTTVGGRFTLIGTGAAAIGVPTGPVPPDSIFVGGVSARGLAYCPVPLSATDGCARAVYPPVRLVLNEDTINGIVHVTTGDTTTVDLGNGTITGDVTVTTGSGTTVDLGSGTITGDVTVTTGDTTTVDLGATTVHGTTTVTSGTVTATGVPTLLGPLVVTAGAITGVTGATGTTINVPGGVASMTAVLPDGATTGNVRFDVSTVVAPPTVPATDRSGAPVTATPIDRLYAFNFAVPTLNPTVPATLTFDIVLASLDAATRSRVLDAVSTGTATLGVASGSVPATTVQTFAVCTGAQTPRSDGCVAVELLPAPGTTTPATVRFTGIAGHFSTWGVVLLPKPDTTPPSVTLTPTGTLGTNGWYVGDVSITTTGTDASGIASCTAPQLLASDTTGTSFNGSCTDNSGVVGNAAPLSVKRDATKPTTTATVVNAPASATVTLAAIDATSGVATTTYAIGSGPTLSYGAPFTITAPGTTRVTFRSVDQAGNREPDRTVDVTIVATTDPCASPATVDSFNRADGRVGANWTGTTDEVSYRITGNRLQARLGGPLLWQSTRAATQAAAVTLAAIDPTLPQGLLLKAQGQTREGGAISVLYDPIRRTVTVTALRTGSFSWTAYPAVNVTLTAGDRLGACATSTGEVRVYRNGALLRATVLSTADQAFFNSRGGRTGIWTLLTLRSVLDDFASA